MSGVSGMAENERKKGIKEKGKKEKDIKNKRSRLYGRRHSSSNY